MKLTRTELWVSTANLTALAAFSAWSFGVVMGRIPICGFCSFSGLSEGLLAFVNLPSFLLAVLVSEAFHGGDVFKLIAIKQLVWLVLSVPQWWVYIAAHRRLRNRLRSKS